MPKKQKKIVKYSFSVRPTRPLKMSQFCCVATVGLWPACDRQTDRHHDRPCSARVALSIVALVLSCVKIYYYNGRVDYTEYETGVNWDEEEEKARTRMCLLRLEDWLKHLAQTEQRCGWCFSCTWRTWIRSRSRFSNDLHKCTILTLNAFTHRSHSFTCKLHHACLYLVSVHQMALPMTCHGVRLIAAYYSSIDPERIKG